MIYQKPILFIDFNGVISYDDFWLSIRDKKHELNKYHAEIEQFLFEDNRDIVQEWMVGKYTSEDIHKIIEDNVGVDSKKLFDVFVNDCTNLDISNNILEQVVKLKPKYHIILVTDNMDSLDRFTFPRHLSKLNRIFDRIDNSYNLKNLKRHNNGSYFIERLKERNSPIKQSILIDDSNTNCEVFKGLGGISYRTTTEQKVMDALRKISN
ncbi:hypothetical protein A3H03_03190 [Candidatus Kuenenbacteria bacterium RIFCSPLOWO2_12_FULL_42_13]|uniref:Uncharacterized protein n=5 Tax=Candidatus Kueneniibacteriota TaxID=1752740 RepID=A0A0G0Z482_9BACT|nr:MAG: hypothetical protein UV02_C0001G0014 [Candidatus Kuenenbacteria bacterium GW2011_GWA2_42_15]OGG89514.1 MAG: hypothetical protein A3C68_01585 [Candidatus Kuenenbacteria bacterium RIFCSPHIGHO2_02_FULL_42_29]OGG90861.1 MAG: hypothetical protein A3H55_00655 [Candidatus Kuenenbacteria bacterium RIFCSPLOWO2_02_FULL_42_16]OGG91561.1 MAG: hypothetical protein A3H03_03190 [Candidatus Kuenenbacteria bacterium RIFCSPLOWO2_12_FULL_42_13]OGG95821.1 MAG: hypothetical protein A2V95_03135 [Candidatus K